MPVSQAFSKSSRSHQVDNISSYMEQQHLFNVGVKVSSPDIEQHIGSTHKKDQCAGEYGHKSRCSSCLCISIADSPISLFLNSLSKPAKHYVQLRHPLHSVFINPPLRPPIS